MLYRQNDRVGAHHDIVQRLLFSEARYSSRGLFFLCDSVSIREPEEILAQGIGPAFPNKFTAELRCVQSGFHAAFFITSPSKYAPSGVRLSRAVWGRSVL
jgi:hypothetical protein